MRDPFGDTAVTPMKHLSVTKIEQAMKCSWALKLRYVDKVPEREVGKFVIGNAVHGVVEHALKCVATGHSFPDAKTLDDFYLTRWVGEIAEREHKQTFLGWNWEIPKEKLHEWGRALVAHISADFLPKVRPWVFQAQPVVEYETKIEYPSAIGPFLVWGYLDLLDERGILVDWKTSDHLPRSAFELGMQFPAYSHEALRITGQEITPCRRIFFLYGEKPEIKIVKFDVKPEDRVRFAEVAADVWKMTQDDGYKPNPDGWWCSKKWCSFFSPCAGEMV